MVTSPMSCAASSSVEMPSSPPPHAATASKPTNARRIAISYAANLPRFGPPVAGPQRLPAPVRRPAAVDHQGVAIDEAALHRVGEEGDGARHILGGGEPPHRHATGD